MLTSKNGKRFVGHVEKGLPFGLGVLKTDCKESYGTFKSWQEYGDHCTVIYYNKAEGIDNVNASSACEKSMQRGSFIDGMLHGLG